MHRAILNAAKGEMIDHKDGNGLNNQKNNLRFCTYSQNIANKAKRNISKQNYKGIEKRKTGITWQTKICVNQQIIYIGTFNDEISAAKAYDKAAIKYFGQFAYLNFPEQAIAKVVK